MLGLWIALAGAAPVELTWQGRVLDATGAPIDGQRELTLTLYDAPTGGAVLHDEQFPDHPVQDGYATVRLGVAEPLDSAALRGEVYVDLAVDGVLLGPRTPLADAPRAGVARDLDGGTARLGDLDVACDAAARGTLRYRGGRFEGCTPGGWQALVTADATGSVALSGGLSVSGDLAVTGTLSDARTYYRTYSVNASTSAALTPALTGSWAAVVSCAITGTSSSGGSVWLLKRSDNIYVERIASFGSTTSNTPEIYASGLDFRIRLYTHSQLYGVRCHFQELI